MMNSRTRFCLTWSGNPLAVTGVAEPAASSIEEGLRSDVKDVQRQKSTKLMEECRIHVDYPLRPI